MKTNYKWVGIGLALCLAWAVFLATYGKVVTIGALDRPSLQPPQQPMRAEFQWPMVDVDGKPANLSSFKGRTILLNVWATWCEPCLDEMPSIASLSANLKLKDKGIVFLCVSIDESAERLQSFLKDQPWKMTMLRATSIPDIFLTDGIPATFVIAPDGRIATSHVGAANWDDPAVVAFLEKLARPAD